ncbi:MAG: PHP domain-containing protein [Actinobacteria bacterium]|nr:PHP domain-containing protein [Actinomycetota bacterium]
MPKRYDLHTHTVHSDGTTQPEDNVSLASEIGLAGLALTDHDTVSGWTQMRDACARHGLAFIPGIELSTERDGRSVHLLGYWVDPTDTALVVECDRLRNERSRRADEICELLASLGVGVEVARVRELAGDAPIGRPHIASAMIEAGHVADVQSAFDDYLADGGPAYVPKYAIDPVRGLRLLADAGGATVLAHPGVSEDGGGPVTPALLDELADAGLSGVEVDHPAHEPEVAARWRALAESHGLLITGASDFHGDRKDLHLGERTTTAATLEQLQGLASNKMHDKISVSPTAS